MRKFFISIIIGLLALSGMPSYAQSTMTDQQVLTYVKQGLAAGKSQKTLMTELAARGVNRAQAERVKKLYDSQQAESGSVDNNQSGNASRSHSFNENSREVPVVDDVELEKEETNDNTAEQSNDKVIKVWGRDIFKKDSHLTFGYSKNMPTPRNYILGAGDEVIIDIYGANQTTLRSEISPEGSINIDVLGPVHISGKTIDEANAYLRQRLSSIYGGLSDDEAATDIQLTIGTIRSIQVDVMGEVKTPGSYVISSLSTVFHALYQAGGIIDPGTVREVKVVRNGKKVASIDVYDFLTTGNRASDIRLEDGDVILIDTYKNIVTVSGAVKREMDYELKDNETLEDLLRYCGGFAKGAYTGGITVVRQQNNDYKVFTVNSNEFCSFALKDGDEIEISKLESRFENRVSINGSVFLSGVYELGKEVRNVRDLIEKAGGLMPEAFTKHAVLFRERPDRTREVLSVDIESIMNGTKSDVSLKNNDELYIPSIFDLEDRGTITISGEVANPGVFPYADNYTLEDLIIQAGGLLRSASTVRVDVSRKIKDSASLTAQSAISELISFEINEDFTIDGASDFVLQPYDEVSVRRSPSYVNSKFIKVSGEVNFPGVYSMSKREERVSDLVQKAGGVNDFAYVKGARLWRTVTRTERLQMQSALKNMQQNGDSVYVDSSDTVSVSIELDKALKNPGSAYDMVLREGDHLEIPVLNTTVKINGAVQMPTTAIYRPSLKKKDYINAAGGYAKGARRTKVFVVSMNGTIKPLNRFTTIDPGSEIYVPKKKEREHNPARTIATMTSVATLGTMIVTMVNVLK